MKARQIVGHYPYDAPSGRHHHLSRARRARMIRPIGSLLMVLGLLLGVSILQEGRSAPEASPVPSEPPAATAHPSEAQPRSLDPADAAAPGDVRFIVEGFESPRLSPPSARSSEERSAPGPGEAHPPLDQRPLLSPRTLPTQLTIPRLDLEAPVLSIPFEDGTWDVRNLGPEVAYLEGTGSIGSGNLVLAGHIIQWGGADGPFRRLFTLEPGEPIILYDGKETREYRVLYHRIVEPTDVEVVQPRNQHTLTLITCTNWDSETRTYLQRRVVVAELIRSHTLLSRDSRIENFQ